MKHIVEIGKLLVRLLQFALSKGIEMMYMMFRMWVGRFLWAWGVKIGLLLIGMIFLLGAWVIFK